MAKPRVFISSTFYDLRYVRADIENFLDSLGYESVRNEEGKISYGKEDALEEYCYKEIQNVDILIAIIGGRFGSESKTYEASVSQQELKTGLKQGKQVYIFIEKNVANEYETYLINKEKEIFFKFVDDVRVYRFIEEIKQLPSNNNIKEFETSYEIVKYLKEQLAGLFQRFLQEQTRIKEINLIRNLESTTKNLTQLVNYLSEENKDKTLEINSILMINHPLIESISEKLNIKYRFYLEYKSDLDELLFARGFKKSNSVDDVTYGELFSWVRTFNGKETTITVVESLFDDEKKLRSIKKSDWNDGFVTLIEKDLNVEDDDLPF